MNRQVLEGLRLSGYSPRTMLDIGAHIGTFTHEFLGVFPGCVPTLVEPNPFCLADLAKLGFEQYGVAASKEAGRAEMFLSKEWLQSTGASLYRENTAFFRDEVTIRQSIEKARLDDLFAGRQFDFVKIDTQGSELDVILGGGAVLARADYILVEVSLVEYNIGGAKAESIFAALDQLGFHCTEAMDFHRLAGVQDGNLLQMDFLFERRGLSGAKLDAATLERLGALAASLERDGRREDALLLLEHLDKIRPGDAQILKRKIKLLSNLGQTLKALETLAALKAQRGDINELLAEIQAQMPAVLGQFNRHLAAGEVELAEPYVAALAALLPGNRAVLDSALSCNLALGRTQHAQRYAAALQAIGPKTGVEAPAKRVATRRQAKRARGRA